MDTVNIAATAASKTEYPRAVFGMAITDIGAMPFNNHGRTLRMVVESNLAASALQVRFSNRSGETPLAIGAASLALCSKDGVLKPETLVPLTAGGTLAFELPAAGELLSDRVRFPLAPGEHFALNLYYPTEERVVSGNWAGVTAYRSKQGNYSADPQLPAHNLVSRFARTIIASDITVTLTSVAEIIAFSDTPGRVLACFGDSITQQSNWTGPFQKLLHHKFPGQITLCNMGISGNRLLHGSPPIPKGLNGISGMNRFADDVLALSGLTHCIIALGTNDIGLPGGSGLPDSELITLEEYIAAMEDLAGQLHSRNVRVYAATLIPRPIAHPYTQEREQLRFAMNDWIRTADCFDAVLDFDAVLRRDDGEPGMPDGCVLPDGLHPSPLGGMLLAKSIDVSLFAGDAP